MSEELHHNLTEEERKRNKYLDKINKEPWPIIYFVAIIVIFLLTTFVIMGVF